MDNSLIFFYSCRLPRQLPSFLMQWQGLKWEVFFKIRTKSGKNKMYGLKWESLENVGTKSGFSPLDNNKATLSITIFSHT